MKLRYVEQFIASCEPLLGAMRAEMGRADNDGGFKRFGSLLALRGSQAPDQKLSAAVAAALDGLHSLPCDVGFFGDRELAQRLGLWSYGNTSLAARYNLLLQKTPGLEYFFLFHSDGRLREAALNKIDGALPAGWLVCALVWRLNDWAEPVRRAARCCAERSLPHTSPGVIADAAIALLPRVGSWGRMGENACVLEEALYDSEVADALADRLVTMREGPAAELLRQALRTGGLDDRLRELAQKAFLPGVRGVALQTLLEGGAAWTTGWGWEWINKSVGEQKRIRLTARRSIGGAPDALALIEAAARDRSALVRRRGSQALVDRRFENDAAIDRLAAIFAADQNRRVREPAEFVQRERAKKAAAEGAGPAA